MNHRHTAVAAGMLLAACAPVLHQRPVIPPAAQELATPLQVTAGDTGQLIWLPAPTGRFRVGRATFHAVDQTRPEPFTADPLDHREVIFHVWYPAAAAGGSPAAYIEVLPDDSVFRSSYAFVGMDKFPRVRTHAFAGAPIAEMAEPFPVILFSHGLGGRAATYTSLQENLASHGYIVVGVDHPFFGAAFKLPGGRTVRNLSRPADRQRDAITQAADLSFVLDVLGQLEHDKTQSLAGKMDLAHVGVFGHSRGGFAAPHACRMDRRFRACVNLDGYEMTPAVMDSGIAQPYMHIEELAPWEPPPTDSELVAAGQTRDQATAESRAEEARRDATFRRMSSGMYLVVVGGAKHLSFSDQPLIAPERYRDITIDARRALEITNAYLLAFFERYLRSRAQRLLEPGSPPFPEVTIEMYSPNGLKEVFRGDRRPQ